MSSHILGKNEISKSNHYHRIMISALRVQYIRHFLHALNRSRLAYPNVSELYLTNAYSLPVHYDQMQLLDRLTGMHILIKSGTVHVQKLRNPNPTVFEEIRMYTFNTTECAQNLVLSRENGILNMIRYTHFQCDFIHAFLWNNDAMCTITMNDCMHL